MKFAFITKYQPTPEQFKLAEEQGIELVHIGDVDAFTIEAGFVLEKDFDFDGVVVVHPAAALRLCRHFIIGVFENANRAPEGERPQFYAGKLHIYDLTDD